MLSPGPILVLPPGTRPPLGMTRAADAVSGQQSQGAGAVVKAARS